MRIHLMSHVVLRLQQQPGRPGLPSLSNADIWSNTVWLHHLVVEIPGPIALVIQELPVTYLNVLVVSVRLQKLRTKWLGSLLSSSLLLFLTYREKYCQNYSNLLHHKTYTLGTIMEESLSPFSPHTNPKLRSVTLISSTKTKPSLYSVPQKTHYPSQ